MREPIDGRTILITGASDGIGRALAEQLDGRAGKLILVARREEALRALADRLTTPTRVLPADLAADGAVDTLLRELASETVDVLINNAGVTVGGAFADQDLDPVIAMLRLNIEAPLRLIHGLLPAWRARGEGAVLDVASVAAFIACPGQSAYAASKSFLHSFSEGLTGEWHGTGLRMTVLAPGSTRTAFFRRGGIDETKLPKNFQTPEQVARVGIRALERGRPLAISGFSNRAMDLAVRFLPRALTRRVARRVLRPLITGEARTTDTSLR